MNRRRTLLLAPAALLMGSASAGFMDWNNGVKVGAKLPEFDAEYIGPEVPSTRKLLLIDFWATWCAPCREEFPHLNDLNARFSSQGLAVMGLTKEPKKLALSFLPKVNIEYSVGTAGTKQLQNLLGIKALPYAVLVNSEDTVVWRGQASDLSVTEVERRLKSAA